MEIRRIKCKVTGGKLVVTKPENIQKLDITKNFIVSECFELGSVMKAFLALAAIAEGVVTLDEEFDCEGKITYVDGDKVILENNKKALEQWRMSTGISDTTGANNGTKR